MKLQKIGYKEYSFVVRADTSDEKGLKEVIIKKGYQRRDFDVLPNEKWLDIGGSIGAFSQYALSKGAFVKAFEPEKGSYDLLVMNTQGFDGKIECYNFGLSDKDETKTLFVNSAKGNFWRSSTVKNWRNSVKQIIELKNIELFIEDGINLKIDCEGAELPIFNKLFQTGLINKINKVVFEWSFDIIPETIHFKNTIDQLRKTHKILNLTEERQKKITENVLYPKNWFPPAIKIFAIKL